MAELLQMPRGLCLCRVDTVQWTPRRVDSGASPQTRRVDVCTFQCRVDLPQCRVDTCAQACRHLDFKDSVTSSTLVSASGRHVCVTDQRWWRRVANHVCVATASLNLGEDSQTLLLFVDSSALPGRSKHECTQSEVRLILWGVQKERTLGVSSTELSPHHKK